MKVLFWTLLVALFIQAKANSKTDCQNEVKETVGKFIEKCQKEYSDKCVRYLLFLALKFKFLFGTKIHIFILKPKTCIFRHENLKNQNQFLRENSNQFLARKFKLIFGTKIQIFIWRENSNF